MKVYLAGPINGQDDATCNDWRNEAKSHKDIEWLDPMVRDYRGQESMAVEEIVNGDKRDILECEVMLANVNIRSVGTSMEIMWAYQNRVRVVIFADDAKKFSPWHLAHSHASVIGSVHDAIKHGQIK